MTKQLQRQAEIAGWPHDIVEQLIVKVEEDTLIADWPPAINSKVEDLEYGAGGFPNAVIRPFKSRSGEYIAAIYNRMLDELIMTEGVF